MCPIEQKAAQQSIIPDAMSAEHAISVSEGMLPAILQAKDPFCNSVESDQACAEISQMLLTCADTSEIYPEAKTSTRAAAIQIYEAFWIR